MIDIQDKHFCVGCNACVQICPKHCITMKEDEEGFLYPHVNKQYCIDCKLCERTCPVIHQNQDRIPLKIFAAVNPDEEVRLKSSSGGVFAVLAEQVVSIGGVVFGARFNERWEVVHDYVETSAGLSVFLQSKYTQSYIGNSFIQAKDFLKQGRIVLFSGTPCQISGLLRFLRKDYDNLITVDVLCHGVPSPGVWRWYLTEECEKNARQGVKNSVSRPLISSIPERNSTNAEILRSISRVSFRDKITGWKKYSFTLEFSEASGRGEKNTVSRSMNIRENPYMIGFLSDWYLRYSCYQCPTRGFRSGSDITLADFWGYPSHDDDKGLTAMAINTEKGSKFTKLCRLTLYPATYEQICWNPAISLHRIETWRRHKFFQIRGKSFHERITIMQTLTFGERMHMLFRQLYLKTIHFSGRILHNLCLRH